MPRTRDNVTWGQLGILFSVVTAIGVAAVGGGFYWLHSDLATLNDRVYTLTTMVTDRIDAANRRLDMIIENTKHH